MSKQACHNLLDDLFSQHCQTWVFTRYLIFSQVLHYEHRKYSGYPLEHNIINSYLGLSEFSTFCTQNLLLTVFIKL